MIEIALSTATQRRPFLPFLPLTVSQRRRYSLDDAAPTSCDRRRHAEPDPNAGGARFPRPINPSKRSVTVVSGLSKTDARTPQIPIDRSGETEPLPARDFVPWRFSDAGRQSAWMASTFRRPRNLHKSGHSHHNRKRVHGGSRSPPKPVTLVSRLRQEFWVRPATAATKIAPSTQPRMARPAARPANTRRCSHVRPKRSGLSKKSSIPC